MLLLLSTILVPLCRAKVVVAIFLILDTVLAGCCVGKIVAAQLFWLAVLYIHWGEKPRPLLGAGITGAMHAFRSFNATVKNLEKGFFLWNKGMLLLSGVVLCYRLFLLLYH